MNDFADLAPFIGGSLKRLEELLEQREFRQVEELQPNLMTGDYSSEIWLRAVGTHYLAVRIDWMGHRQRGLDAHFHLERFPVHQFNMYILGPKGATVEKFDPFTGRPCKRDPHAGVVRDDS